MKPLLLVMNPRRIARCLEAIESLRSSLEIPAEATLLQERSFGGSFRGWLDVATRTFLWERRASIGRGFSWQGAACSSQR
jgi:hypothetical protein